MFVFVYFYWKIIKMNLGMIEENSTSTARFCGPGLKDILHLKSKLLNYI